MFRGQENLSQWSIYSRRLPFSLWQIPDSSSRGEKDTKREYSVARAARIIIIVGPNAAPVSHSIANSPAAHDT
jgi:hypothetical protein